MFVVIKSNIYKKTLQPQNKKCTLLKQPQIRNL